MIHSVLRRAIVLMALFAVASFSGCSRKTEPPGAGDSEAVKAAQKLPDGTNVLAALDQKDYAGAVSGLAKVRESVTAPEQFNDLTTLELHVTAKLADASGTDDKAAEALRALSIMKRGR